MSADQIAVEARDGVLAVTVNRPEKHNALSLAILGRLREVFETGGRDETLVAAVLTGAGERAFAAGGDLRELAAFRTREAAEAMAREARAALEAIRTFPVPVIAALNGDAYGGGAELAVACDFRVAAAHARIGFVQGRLRVSTAWGGGPDLLGLLGRSRALRLLTTSEMVGAREALALGLVDAVAAEGEPLAAALDAFLAPMRRQAPHVVRAFKALAAAERRGETRAAMNEMETRMFVETWIHDDHWEAAEKVLPARR